MINRISFVTIGLLIAILMLWHFRTTGEISLQIFLMFVCFVFICVIYGEWFLSLIAPLIQVNWNFPFSFLSGFFLFNSFLFALTLASPFGMVINIAILLLIAIGLFAYGFWRQGKLGSVNSGLPGLLCILVSGLAATFWCSDSQPPLIIEEQTAIFQTWQDTFIHVREISVFAQAHGISTIHDIKLAGAAAPIYHFASYVTPAAITVLTGAAAMDVYSSFQLPFGIFLTGLAAFALIASIWGDWPALAAASAIVLLPDAYQQGFANRYLSYNFLAQVNLGMLYGIACAAMAWIFVLEGSRRGKFLTVLIGYLFLGISLFYKAHIFVANAYLILIYPWFFFNGVRWRWRMMIVILLTLTFFGVVNISQTNARVPVMRLDGSGIGRYLLILIKDFDAGFFQSFFTKIFVDENHSKPIQGLYAIAMLILSTFGMWLVATPVVMVAGRKKIAAAILFFPVVIIVNYLVMSIGLALDSRGIGTPDELLNRPLVWAYFVVVAWTAGFGYYLVFGNSLPKVRPAKYGLLILFCVATMIPLFISKNLQTFPARSGFSNYKEFNAVPVCLVQASEYIKNHSSAEEIIQDSMNDPKFVVTALSERQLFAGQGSFGGLSLLHNSRLDGLVDFMKMSDVNELRNYASSQKISWYLLHPGSSVAWPFSFLQTQVFTCDGYRVYRFKV